MLLCCWAGYVYVIIELCYRGMSDITMMFCASICVLPMIFLNNWYGYDMDLLAQAFVSALFCTIMEFIFGIIFNAEHTIWNYSNMWLNIRGQICPLFFLVWMLISVPIIFFMDWTEYNIFGGCE